MTIGSLKLLKKCDIDKVIKYQKWLCECLLCGNIIESFSNNLTNSYKKGIDINCGCKTNRNKSVDAMLKFQKEKDRVEGTQLTTLRTEEKSNRSKTGVTGVTINKCGNYIAQIGFKRKNIYLGTFSTIEEAKKARRKAEEELYDPILKKYKSNIGEDDK